MWGLGEERDRDRERQGQRHRERETGRQIDKQTERLTETFP